MKKPITTFILVLFVRILHSQVPSFKQWDYRFGGTDSDVLTTFQQTSDGGFILGGFTWSGAGGDKTQMSQGGIDYWIVKLDSLGIKQWDKNFGGTGNEYLYSLQQTKDDGYILGGISSSGISGNKTQALRGIEDYWIVKTDSIGNYQWDKDFGGTTNDLLYSLQQCADGGYLLGGWSNSDSSGDKTQASYGASDYWIVKTDSLGNKLWDKDFGGTDFDLLYSLQQTTDGGFILGGYSLSGISGEKTQATFGDYDYWMVKADSLGNKQWDKDFGGTMRDELHSLQQTADGGFILGGVSFSGISGNKTTPLWGGGSPDFWVIKTDTLGNIQWEKDMGGTDYEDEFGNISQTSDKGYLIAGTSYSPISGIKSENNLGLEQMWIVKTDLNGNKLWDKTMLTDGHDEIGLAIQTKDGCFAFANSTFGGIAGYKTQASQGLSDYWITKYCQRCNLPSPFLTQSGDTLSVPPVYSSYQWYHNNIAISGATQSFYLTTASGYYYIIVTDSDNCSVGSGIINVIASVELANSSGEFIILPNPTKNTFILKNISTKEKTVVEIMNVLGEIVYTEIFFGRNEYKVDANIAKGIYFVLVSDKEKNVVRKLIVE